MRGPLSRFQWTRRSRRRLVVLALFSVVLNLWAPVVTASLAALSGQRVALPEHCQAMALEHAAQHPGDPGSGKSPSDGASCPFCFAHAGSVGLAQSAIPPMAAVATEAISSTPSKRAPLADASWTPASARAPPVDA